MKKILATVALAVAVTVAASAQSGLGNLLNSLGGSSSAASTIGNMVSSLAGTVYSAPVSLDGTYSYNGIAISASKSDGNVLSNLAGTAVTSGLETKADEYLAKVGIRPGAMEFTFNASEKSFVVKVGSLSIPGTYKVGDGEKTVTLTFGKSMKFLSMTGTLESTSSGAKMLFTVNKAMDFIKKVTSLLGQSSSQVAATTKLADGYDNFRIGFKMAK